MKTGGTAAKLGRSRGGIAGLAVATLVSIGCGGGKGNGSGAAGTTGAAGAGGDAGAMGGAGGGASAGTTGAAGTTGVAGSGGMGGRGGAGAGGATLGCPSSVTPTAALITDFPQTDGGVTVIAAGVPGGVFTNSDTPVTVPPPSLVVVGGAWSIDFIAVAGGETAIAKFGIYFSPPNSACVDAHTYAGISFKIGGMISGCTLDYLLADSEETSHADDMMHGGCTATTCQASKKTLTLPPTPTVVQIPWGDLAGGLPAGAIDTARLTSVGWQLTIPPAPDGGTAACIAQFTIDDVTFY